MHGLPGTGKSAVIAWIYNLSPLVLKWEHGNQFFCLAFQHQMAASIRGATLHAAAEIPAQENAESRRLTAQDISSIFIRNQNLRWIIIDEISMVSSSLLAQFEDIFRRAVANDSLYKNRARRKPRLFGGYNLIMAGDWWQLPPIPDSHAPFRPPARGDSQGIKNVRYIFWQQDTDRSEHALKQVWEFTIQKRCDGSWYNEVSLAARDGQLADEQYNYLHGFSTKHAGSWMTFTNATACGQAPCQNLPNVWLDMAREGRKWDEMRALECDI